MGQIALTLPTAGSTPNSTADPMINNAFQAVQSAINGNIDSTNIAAALAQSAAINQGGQVVKGAVNIAAAQSTGGTTYTTLATPDQVSGIVLPSNGLIAVWYQALWQESVAGAGRAAIFLNSNQLSIAVSGGGANDPGLTAAATNSTAAGQNQTLTATSVGLGSGRSTGSAQAPDVTTGQITGIYGFVQEIAGGITTNMTNSPGAGPCYIFAAAGTYTVSVQFKASSGSVTASNRKLWVQALSFA